MCTTGWFLHAVVSAALAAVAGGVSQYQASCPPPSTLPPLGSTTKHIAENRSEGVRESSKTQRLVLELRKLNGGYSETSRVVTVTREVKTSETLGGCDGRR